MRRSSRGILLATLLGLSALAWTGCASEPMSVKVISVALHPAAGSSRIGSGGVEEAGGRLFSIIGGVPGTIVIEFSSTTGYETCTVNLNGSRGLPPRHVSYDGIFEVQFPAPALDIGRTTPASLACTGSPLGRRDASDTFQVKVVAGVAFRLEPEQVDFGRVSVGSSTSRDIVLTNTGSEPFALSAVSVTGTTGRRESYLSADDGCQKGPLAPGAACTMRLTFAPVVTPTDELYDGVYIFTGNLEVTAEPTAGGFSGRGTVAIQGMGVPVVEPPPPPPADTPHHPPVG